MKKILAIFVLAAFTLTVIEASAPATEKANGWLRNMRRTN